MKVTLSEYLDQLILNLRTIHKHFKSQHATYMKITKETYDKKFDIPDYSDEQRRQFVAGKQVLYYIGDVSVAMKKWKQKYSGPWRILQRLDNRTVVIVDPKDSVSMRVTIDRLKLYIVGETESWLEMNKLAESRIYTNYQVKSPDKFKYT